MGEILGRLNWMSAGYFLFRVTSDIERLPFPMAPVAASGATALAEAASKEESWRWRVFSIGTDDRADLRLLLYRHSGLYGRRLRQGVSADSRFPFFDLTTNTETILPGAVTGISGDLGKVLTGFVIPYPIVPGSLVGSLVCRVVGAPFLYHIGAVRRLRNQRLDARHGRLLYQAGDRHQVLAVGRHRLASRGRDHRLLQRLQSVLARCDRRAQNRGMKLKVPKGAAICRSGSRW